jgi:bifunctional UDP-N-acetylglucosamine pyrophosphorylase/glucosamine-1-phosphate N-acetyltransferase
MELAIIILAAGKGTRMGLTDKPKVMAELSGKPLLGHVIDAILPLAPQHIIPVIGFKKELVEEYLDAHFNGLTPVYQTEQLGTGHAVMQANERLKDFTGHVLILTGDTPLIQTKTLSELLIQSENLPTIPDAITVTTFLDEPKGYGRILRTASGDFFGIVEEKDASVLQKGIQEINTGMFLVNSLSLFEALGNISNANAQGEYYLTDIIAYLHGQQKDVYAIPSLNSTEFMGINTLQELASAEEVYAAMQKDNR